MVVGDEAVVSEVRRGMSEELASQGLAVEVPVWLQDRLRLDHDPLVSDLLTDLGHEGFDVLIDARTVRLGDRTLRYYGREELQTVDRLEVNAYLVDGQTVLGSGWSQELAYTSLSIERVARESVHALAPEVAGEVRRRWRRVPTP